MSVSRCQHRLHNRSVVVVIVKADMQSNSQRRRTRQDKKRRRTRENCKLWISQNIFVRVVRPSVRWLFGEWNRLESPWPFQFSDHFLRLARSGFTLLVERVFNYSRDGARRWRRNEMEKLIIKKGDPFLMTCFLFVFCFSRDAVRCPCCWRRSFTTANKRSEKI